MTEQLTVRAETTPGRSRVAWRTIGVVALAATLCASLTWLVVGPWAGVAMEVHDGGGATHEVGLGAVVLSTPLIAGAGGALLRWWQGRSARALRHWTILAVTVAVLSLITPTSAVSPADGMALVSLHAVVAAVVIVAFRRAGRVR